jgi:N-acetyl-gamma-glutamyl-phosphate reductase
VFDVAVVGAPGYAGVELTRLVLGHPDMELVCATSSSEAGRRIDSVYPVLTGLTDLAYVDPSIEAISAEATVAFLAVPHTAALEIAPSLLDAGMVVVDASADYRLEDPLVYEAWYDTPHTSPELLEMAVYGLPEMNREAIHNAQLIACPGCYPTAAVLAAMPALEAGVTDATRIVVDAKSGVSGAGRVPGEGTHFPSVNESVAPYKVGVHRHTPEIEQQLTLAASRPIKAIFTPHLVPLTRGLLSTVYIELEAGVDSAGVHTLYADRYQDEPFVTVYEPDRMPATADVRGTNRAHIGLVVDERTGMLVAACAIDNLVKGTSGQAVQCANLALGLPETAGLDIPVPVV